METRVISMSDIVAFVRTHLSPVVAVLFGGDRFSCCDEGVGVFVDGILVGIATIAPCGEGGSGIPTIVGVYVVPAYRGRGAGTALLHTAIERCCARGFSRIHVDIMSTGIKKTIVCLPGNLRAILDINDMGTVLDALP